MILFKFNLPCGSNTSQIMYGETSNVSDSDSNIKCQVGKSSFAIKTIANADTGSLKSLRTLFDTYSDHMLAIFKPNRIVRGFLQPFLTNCSLHFERRFCS